MATGQRSNDFSTYLFLHLNTTCLPGDGQPCRITEICLLAVNPNSLKNNSQQATPVMPRILHKLVWCLKPGYEIQEKAFDISRLTNEKLADCPSFSEIITSLKSFLYNLPKPVCLIAHNGDDFDFAVLQAELTKARQSSLFRNFYCADSLKILRYIDTKTGTMNKESTVSISPVKRKTTDDDSTSRSMLKKSKTAPTTQTEKETSSMKRSQSIPVSFPTPRSYKLREYYEDMFSLKPKQSHTAEGFCRALIRVAKSKPGFFDSVKKHAKEFDKIEPALIN